MNKSLLFVLLLLSGCAQQSNPVAFKPNNNWSTGVLDNGLKYHIYPLETEALSLRLFVHAGSLQETPSQRGYAHFVEHMAFNGSENFTPNEVIELMEKTGASGYDVNAYTSFQETMYRLTLPNQDELDKGLLWLRDVANRVSFDPAEVERERGVVLAEYRRATPKHPSFYSQEYDFRIRESVYEDKSPIGVPETLNNATSDSLRAFYRSWYQPQYSELILVGDVNRKDMEAKIEQMFGDWQPTTEAPKPQRVSVERNPGDFITQLDGHGSATFNLSFPRGDKHQGTRDQQVSYWMDDIAAQLIELRLDAVFERQALPLQELVSELYYSQDQRVYESLISFAPQNRTQVQTLFLQTLAAVRDHGVTQAELDSVRASYRKMRKYAEEDWHWRTAQEFAEEKTDEIALGEPTQSLRSYTRSLDQLLRQTNLTRVNQHLKGMLSSKYDVSTGVASSESIASLEQTLPEWKSMYSMLGINEDSAPLHMGSFVEPQQSKPLPAPVQLNDDEQTWALDNGIDIVFDSDSNNDFATVVYMSAGGNAALDRSLIPASQLLISTIIRSGIAEFNGSDLKAYLRTQNIDMQMYINGSEHGVEITLPKEKLVDALRLINNAILHANVDQQQLDVLKKEQAYHLITHLKQPLGQWDDAVLTNTYARDSRYYPVYAHDMDAITVEQLQQAYQQLFHQSRNSKLVIVADVDVDQFRDGLETYVTTLPLTTASLPSYRQAFSSRPDKKINLAIGDQNDAHYMLKLISNDVRAQDIQLALIDDVLEIIVQQHLDKVIREQLSLDYSPEAYYWIDYNQPQTVWTMKVQSESTSLAEVEQAVDEIVSQLSDTLTQQDVETAKKQLDGTLKEDTNNSVDKAWYKALFRVNRFGENSFDTLQKTVDSITIAQVRQRAREAFGAQAQPFKYILSPLD
ncbi:M16 family metallopeptidase [Vibrio ostreicida]|uniref:M16 family metallopeptidase n=1 Tax=Vibrio ostreicida TaxID=526588 RepID=UPI003B5A01C8